MSPPHYPPPEPQADPPGSWGAAPVQPAPDQYPGGQGWTGFDANGQPPQAEQQRPWWQRATSLVRVGILLVVGISVIGGWLGGAKRDDAGAIKDDGTLAATDLRVGDCYNEPEGETFAEVTATPCTQPHDSEVFHVSQLTGSTFPQDAAVLAAAETECLPNFETYVGTTYQESALDVGYISPSQELWDDGDRSLVCTAHNLDGSQLTASVKGSAR